MLPIIDITGCAKGYQVTQEDIWEIIKVFVTHLKKREYLDISPGELRISKGGKLLWKRFKNVDDFKSSLSSFKESVFYLCTGLNLKSPQFVIDGPPGLGVLGVDLPPLLIEFLDRVLCKKITPGVLISIYKELIHTLGPPPKQGHKKPGNVIAEGTDYQILWSNSSGDLTDSYLVQYKKPNGVAQRAVMKVIQDVQNNDLMLNEIKILKLLHHKSLPVLLDNFRVKDGRLAIVLDYIDGFNLTEIRKQYPKEVPQEHVCWILERLLSVLGFMHKEKVIHGGVEPSGILVRPKDHNAFLLNFLFSVFDPGEHGAFLGAIEDYSAPEVYEQRSPKPATDMYSLGKCMVYLLGGNPKTGRVPNHVHPKIQAFIAEFLDESPVLRKSDAWQAHRELSDLRKEVFGARNQFLEFKMT